MAARHCQWQEADAHERTLPAGPTCRAHGHAADRARLVGYGMLIRLVRAALLEILQCACFVVDTPEGRVAG
ncbi:hypothetical protein GCM10010399_34350 [Dactylosporangium fulvum]